MRPVYGVLLHHREQLSLRSTNMWIYSRRSVHCGCLCLLCFCYRPLRTFHGFVSTGPSSSSASRIAPSRVLKTNSEACAAPTRSSVLAPPPPQPFLCRSEHSFFKPSKSLSIAKKRIWHTMTVVFESFKRFCSGPVGKSI